MRQILFVCTGNVFRSLTADMLHSAVTVIAMSTDHREFIARRFGRRDVSLFTQACGLAPAPLLDVGEAIVNPDTNPAAVEAHIRLTVDRILELTPQLASRLVGFRA
jgi:hypothetical protein